jgi:hypothetical protein
LNLIVPNWRDKKMEKAVMTSEYLLTIARDTIEVAKYCFLITLSESGRLMLGWFSILNLRQI